jgi:hypothetical protein
VNRISFVLTLLAIVAMVVLGVLPLATRRRNAANRHLTNLGSVSTQWLQSHRQEDL